MAEKIKIKRLTAKSLFKLILVANSSILIPFSILCGVLSLFGMGTVKWNDQPLTGITGLIVSPFIGLFLTILFSIIAWIGLAIGSWIYSKFRSIELEFIPSE